MTHPSNINDPRPGRISEQDRRRGRRWLRIVRRILAAHQPDDFTRDVQRAQRQREAIRSVVR